MNHCCLCELSLNDKTRIEFSCQDNYCYYCLNYTILNYYSSENSFKEFISDDISIKCSKCNNGELKNSIKYLLDLLKIKNSKLFELNLKSNKSNTQESTNLKTKEENNTKKKELDKLNSDLKNPNHLFKNINSNDNKDFINNKLHSKTIICYECNNSNSIYYCIQCDSYLCVDCNIHEKYNSLKNHSLILTNSLFQKSNIENKKYKETRDRLISDLNELINNLKNLNFTIGNIQKMIVEKIDDISHSLENAQYHSEVNRISQNLINSIHRKEDNVISKNIKKNHFLKQHSDYSSNFLIKEEILKVTNDFFANTNKLIKIEIEDKLIELNNLFTLKSTDKCSLSNISLNQNIECENIQLIYRPNIFTIIEYERTESIINSDSDEINKEDKKELLLIWAEKSNEIMIYDILINEIKAVLKGHLSNVSSIKHTFYTNGESCINKPLLLSTGNENIVWDIETYSILLKIENIGFCFASDFFSQDYIGFLSNKSKSDIRIYSFEQNINLLLKTKQEEINLNEEYIFNSKCFLLSQNNSILAMYYWENVINKTKYIFLCGMEGDESSRGICQIINFSLPTKKLNANNFNEEYLDSKIHKSFYSSNGAFIVKCQVYVSNGRLNVVYISQNGELFVSDFDTGVLIKQFKFYSLCDFYFWDDKTIILLGDEINNYIVFSLSTLNVNFIANKDHSYSINSMRINYLGNKNALIVLDSNCIFKIYN